MQTTTILKYEALIQAIKNNNTCIVKYRNNKTGEIVPIICHLITSPTDDNISISPIALIINQNEYSDYIPLAIN
jgi:hypothetical protein